MGKITNGLKILAMALSCVFCLTLLGTSAYAAPAGQLANEDIIFVIGCSKAYVNGEIKQIDPDNPKVFPILKDNVVMVPLKFIAQGLGASVEFDANASAITVTLADKSLKLFVGKDILQTGGFGNKMEAPVLALNGRAMVPVRPFAEALGKKAFWNKKGMVVIGSQTLNPSDDQAAIEDMVFKISGDKYWYYNYSKDYVPLEDIKAKVVLPEITADMVKEAFNKNNMKDVHPRLIANQQDIDRMRKLIADKDEFALMAFKNIIDTADISLKSPLPKWELDEANLRVHNLHEQSYDIPRLAFAYILTDDKKYAKKAWELMEAFSNFQDWGYPRHFLDGGVGATNISIGYDLLYNYLKAPQRQIIEDALKTKAVDAGLQGMNTNQFWTWSEANWNGICHTGIRLASYMLFEKDPDYYSMVIATALNRERLYIKAFEPAGQSEEGQSYFDYGFSFAELGFEADVHVLGTDFGLTDTNGLKSAGWFPQRTSGPVAGLSIGDSDVFHAPNTSRHWFAKRFNDVGLAKIIYSDLMRKKLCEWRDLLFYDPQLYKEAQSAKKVTAQLNNYIPGIEVVTLRNSWDSNANFIAIHGGANNASHGHIDAGQFDIQSRGMVWIMGSLGRDNYQFPGYFDSTSPKYDDPKGVQTKPGRLHFYRLRTEGKSCVVINGDGQPDIRPEQDENGVAKVEQIVSKPRGSFAIIDLTSPYNRDVIEYKRGIMINNDTEIMTVQDEITTKQDTSKVWWLANTPAQQIRIQPDGKSAILEQNGQKMWVGVQSPSNAKLKEIPATYLPGESFPLTKNSKETTKKLAIEMSNVSKVTITVNFIPLEPWQDKPEVTIPPLKSMKSWSIPDGHLFNLEKPSLADIKVNNVSLKDFKPDYRSYIYSSAEPIDSETMPTITAVGDYDIKTEQKGNKFYITVTDKNDSTNSTIYVVTVQKTGLPQNSKELKVKGAAASAVPEAQHGPQLTIDGSLDGESRWSAQGAQWIQYDLGDVKDVNYLGLAIFNGATRSQIFDVQTSEDGVNWKDVYSGRTSGTSNDLELFVLQPSKARYVKLLCNGNTSNDWNSIVETKIYGN